jgi:streptogramin lyase
MKEAMNKRTDQSIRHRSLRLFVATVSTTLWFALLPQPHSQASPEPVSVTTIAGTGNRGFVDGPGKSASFSAPSAIAIDSFGVLYVADTGNNAIRKIDTSGVVTTLVGDGSRGFTDGSAREASFNAPSALSVDRQGNIFVADAGNNAIRKVAPDGNVTTIAGTGKPGSTSGTGGRTGTATFSKLKAIAIDRDNNLFVVDDVLVRKIDKDANVTTYGPNVSIDFPSGIAVDNTGTLYVASPYAGIKKVSATGDVTPLVSNSTRRPFIGPGPINLAVEANGVILLSDAGRNTIEQLDTPGALTLIAGSSSPGFTNGPGGTNGSATLRSPGGITVDSDGTLFIADTQNNSIRKIVGSRSSGAQLSPSSSAPSTQTPSTTPTAETEPPSTTTAKSKAAPAIAPKKPALKKPIKKARVASKKIIKK